MYFPVSKYWSLEHWNDWRWQERNAVRSVEKLFELFPALGDDVKQQIEYAACHLRFKLTPYLLSLIQVDHFQNPLQNDPIWNQFVPTFDRKAKAQLDISSFEENWEMPEEMVNPILQHKYQNRVNFRIQNSCLAYCMYCFEAKRVLDTHPTKESLKPKYFDQSIEYIKNHREVSEVVISGGEPLVLSNDKLRHILAEIRKLPQVTAIRIQTRAFVHNPFRLDDEFIQLLKEFDVTAMAFHISHPREVSKDCEKIIQRFSDLGCRTMLLSHIPLLKGINDTESILAELFMKIYSLKIKPYYLLHAMPDTVGARKFRTSVRKGVRLMKRIKRNYSNPALPEYVIVHKKGKHTVPQELEGTSEFIYEKGNIEFLNWKGEWCMYEDSEDMEDLRLDEIYFECEKMSV